MDMMHLYGLGPYKLKPTDASQHLFACVQLLQMPNRKGFLHHIVLEVKK